MYTCWSIKLFGSRFEKKHNSHHCWIGSSLGWVRFKFGFGTGRVRGKINTHQKNFTSDSYVYIQKYMLTFMFNRDLSIGIETSLRVGLLFHQA